MLYLFYVATMAEGSLSGILPRSGGAARGSDRTGRERQERTVSGGTPCRVADSPALEKSQV